MYRGTAAAAAPGSIPVTSLALGPVNTVLWSNGVANQWSANPIVTSLTASSFVAVGPTPALSGAYRMSHNTAFNGRNNLNNADLPIFTWGAAANALDFGGAGIGRIQFTAGTGSFMAFIVGTTAVAAANSVSFQLQANNTTQAEAAYIAAARRVVALNRGSALTATEMPANTGDEVVYQGNAATNPTANSVGGPIHYASAGASIARGTGGTITTYAPA